MPRKKNNLLGKIGSLCLDETVDFGLECQNFLNINLQLHVGL